MTEAEGARVAEIMTKIPELVKRKTEVYSEIKKGQKSFDSAAFIHEIYESAENGKINIGNLDFCTRWSEKSQAFTSLGENLIELNNLTNKIKDLKFELKKLGLEIIQ